MGIGILNVSFRIRKPGMIPGILWVVYWGLVALYSGDSLIHSRRKALKNMEEEERKRFKNSLAIEENLDSKRKKSFEHNIEEEWLKGEWKLVDNKSLDMSVYSEINTDRVLNSQNSIKSLSNLGKAIYGDFGYKFAMTSLMMLHLSAVIGYLSFIKTYFPTLIVIIIIMPIWMFFNLRWISYVSLIGLFLMLSSIFVILSFIFNDFLENNNERVGEIEYFHPNGIPLFFGVWIFIYEGSAVLINIENSMRNPKDYFKVSSVGTMINIPWILLMTVIPYLIYLDNAEDIIIDSLSNSNVRNVVKIAYVTAVSSTIPIIFYPVSDTVYRSESLNYFRIFRNHPSLKFYSATVVFLVFCQLVSEWIPNMGSFLNIGGSIVGVMTTIVLPLVFYNKAYEKCISYKRLAFNWFLILFSSVLGIYSWILTIQEEFL